MKKKVPGEGVRNEDEMKEGKEVRVKRVAVVMDENRNSETKKHKKENRLQKEKEK